MILNVMPHDQCWLDLGFRICSDYQRCEVATGQYADLVADWVLAGTEYKLLRCGGSLCHAAAAVAFNVCDYKIVASVSRAACTC